MDQVDKFVRQSVAESQTAGCNVVEVVFANHAIIPGKLYSIEFKHDEFLILVRRLSACFPNDRPQHRSFKRYSYLDLTCDNYLNKDVRVHRSTVGNCVTFVQNTPTSVDEGWPCIGMTVSRIKLPVSAFPCRTDLDNVRYMRQTTFNLEGGAAELRIESSCDNLISPLFFDAGDSEKQGHNPGRSHRISIVIDVHKSKTIDIAAIVSRTAKTVIDNIRLARYEAEEHRLSSLAGTPGETDGTDS